MSGAEPLDPRFTLKSVTIRDGIHLQYVVQGDSSSMPVLLLHGFVDSWRSFERVLPHLPPSVYVLAPTQRGHGESSHPESGYSVNDFAADLLSLMDALDLPRSVIVGHSMGSAVATRFAIDQPQRTAGLVLVGASSGLAASEAARQFWDATLAELKDPVDPQLVRGMTEDILSKPVPQAFLDAVAREGMKVPAHVWKQAFESRWKLEGDFSKQLTMIEAPTLIIWGEQDARYSRADEATLAAAIPKARLLVYRDAGHMLHWEEPRRFASDLAAFVQGVD